MEPESGRRKPSRHERSVVFPAPLGPIRPTVSPRADLQGHAVERPGAPAESAVGLRDVLDRDHAANDTRAGFSGICIILPRFLNAVSPRARMIEVQNLSKRYPTRLAVDDVTFSVREGEIVGFLGPNGAGKTTTMRVLTGFLPPTSGTARVAGLRRRDAVQRRAGARSDTCPSPPPRTRRCGSTSTWRSGRAWKASRGREVKAAGRGGARPAACSGRSRGARSRTSRRGSGSGPRSRERSSTSRPS